ncbi:molybdenum cofactor guanylyltransferase [Alysiella crassa]|uniref:Molybdopterin-guanine dinucleotide biosynthesis protein MobA n=1 Tax=Alysiella crassa TaxID=153491 RepID=A0A376BT36_9NEIS|nr:molybdenum cofactor guanylyltransferase [Alysiella crassa]UOP07908.1 molybdenum cofactor guanylyltransferase [Alysiella crassa]SSY79963.1 molybdopterin-guanine dinucleotide biosynthesis protein MobA [Alysiella crassa]
MNNPLLILCGGRSSRMGSPKPLLLYRGQTLIARQVADSIAHRPVWLASDGTIFPNTDGATYLADYLPDKQGALSAILSALILAEKHGFSGVYVMSCDTLWLPENMIALLKPHTQNPIFEQGISIFQDNGQWLPLLGFWSVVVAGSLKDWLDSGNKRVQHFVKHNPHQTIDLPKEWAKLSNFNTPDEFEQAVLAANQFQAA